MKSVSTASRDKKISTPRILFAHTHDGDAIRRTRAPRRTSRPVAMHASLSFKASVANAVVARATTAPRVDRASTAVRVRARNDAIVDGSRSGRGARMIGAIAAEISSERRRGRGRWTARRRFEVERPGRANWATARVGGGRGRGRRGGRRRR